MLERVRATIDTVFGADLRSLAVFRMALAGVVLADLLYRAQHLEAHYTDAGVLPRDVLIDGLAATRVSLALANGTLAFAAVLFGAAILAAIAMLVGYRTRIASVVVFVLVLSIQSRNPLVGSDADTLLRVLLFWAMLLPLGAAWSVDRAQGRVAAPISPRFLSFATAGLFLQIAFMYWFTYLLKTGAEWRVDHTALQFALSADHLSTPLGEALLAWPDVLRALSFGTIWLEALGPFLLLSPILTPWLRLLGIASYMGLHAGIAATMDIGIFPWLSGLCMVSFLPTMFWEAVLPRVAAIRARFPALFPGRLHPADRPTTAFTGLPGALRARVRRWEGLPAPTIATATAGGAGFGSGRIEDEGAPADEHPIAAAEPPPARAPRGREIAVVDRLSPHPVVNVVAAAALIAVFFWNVGTVSAYRVPEPVATLTSTFGLSQGWNMFAPRPSRVTTWFAVPGTLADGRQLDLAAAIVHDDPSRATTVSFDRPTDFEHVYPDKYWRKYLSALRDNRAERRAFAGYICRTWNAQHTEGSRLVELDLVEIRSRTQLGAAPTEPDPDVLSTHSCR